MIFSSFIKVDGSLGKYGGESHPREYQSQEREKERKKEKRELKRGGKLGEAFVYLLFAFNLFSHSHLFLFYYIFRVLSGKIFS